MSEPEAPAIALSTTIAATPDAVWRALLDGTERTAWWPQLERLDPEAGGRFEERWHDGEREVVTSGAVEVCEAPRRLELSWADEGWPAGTRVIVDLRGDDERTSVVVVHTGWEALPGGAGLAARHEAGWRRHLDALREHVEG